MGTRTFKGIKKRRYLPTIYVHTYLQFFAIRDFLRFKAFFLDIKLMAESAWDIPYVDMEIYLFHYVSDFTIEL